MTILTDTTLPATPVARPRPSLDAVLSLCPTWCRTDHTAEFGPDARPDVWSDDDGAEVWDVSHRVTVGEGVTAVTVDQWSAIRLDGTVSILPPVELTWDVADKLGGGGSPSQAAELGANLCAAAMLTGAGGA